MAKEKSIIDRVHEFDEQALVSHDLEVRLEFGKELMREIISKYTVIYSNDEHNLRQMISVELVKKIFESKGITLED